MMRTSSRVVCISAALLLALTAFSPFDVVVPAKADTVYMFVSDGASALNSSYEKYNYETSTHYGPYSCGAAEIANDSWVLTHGGNPYTDYEAAYSIETSDFTNPDWDGGVTHNYDYCIEVPDNGTATIYYVMVVAIVSANFASITPQFAVSVDGGSTYEVLVNSTFSYDPYEGVYFYYKNITWMYAWTPAMFNSTSYDTVVYFDVHLSEGTYYTIDYVGLSFIWYTPYQINGKGIAVQEPTPVEEEESGSDAPAFSLNMTGSIPAILGFAGFVGMIALPALGFVVYRNTDEGKLVIFIKITAAFMVCLSMFLIAISS